MAQTMEHRTARPVRAEPRRSAKRAVAERFRRVVRSFWLSRLKILTRMFAVSPSRMTKNAVFFVVRSGVDYGLDESVDRNDFLAELAGQSGY
ncbi:MAG: hypothetical protein KIT73_20470, partial [Burkholderiales bacterium]|nr:hypothetical protein [Burkholderiales bacterium]